MSEHIIIVPEIIANTLLCEFDNFAHNAKPELYHFHDVIRNNFKPLSQDEAFKQLDLWQKINIWSNSPAYIISKNDIRTDTFVDYIKSRMNTDQMFFNKIAYKMSSSHLSLIDVTNWLKCGAPEVFTTQMMNLRRTSLQLLNGA